MPTLQRAPTRNYHTVMMDSRRWDSFQPRTGDVVVATYPKCGTTWTQRIVDLLFHQSPDPRPLMQTYPWLDATFFAPEEANREMLEAQTHRRAVKSHLPFDALPIYDDLKYIHTVRDGRDACFSFHNHQLGLTDVARDLMGAQAVGPGFPPPPPTPEDPRAFYLQWIEEAEAGEAQPPGGELPFFEFEMTYWRERRRPNLLLVHYNDLKADLVGEMARISAFLDIDTPASLLPQLAKAAEFETMKAQGEGLLPMIEMMFDGGSGQFLNKGSNGRWKDKLTDDDLARFDRLAEAKFSPPARAWIEGGRLAAGEPRDLAD